MKTGADGASPVPGSEIPMFACLDSPGPFTTQPITASVRFSTPSYFTRHSGMRARTWSCTVFASSWKNVLVVRPQPGHAVTSGVNARRPMVCSSSCATITSRVRGSSGSGVSDTRMVSPMPSASSTASAALEATMPLLPMPASVRPRCSAWPLRVARSRYTATSSCTPLTLQLSTMRSAGSPISTARAAESSAERISASRATRAASHGSARAWFSSISCASSAWSSEPQFAPMRTGLSWRMAVSTIAPNCASRLRPKPTLPGLIRYFASATAQAGSAASSWWPL